MQDLGSSATRTTSNDSSLTAVSGRVAGSGQPVAVSRGVAVRRGVAERAVARHVRRLPDGAALLGLVVMAR
jgi:hypothetical protein